MAEQGGDDDDNNDDDGSGGGGGGDNDKNMEEISTLTALDSTAVTEKETKTRDCYNA